MRRALIAILLLGCASDPAVLESVEPESALVGTSVTVRGLGFGPDDPASHLVVYTLDDEIRLELDTFVESWSETEVTFVLPEDFLGPMFDARTFGLHVEREDSISNCLAFSVELPPDPRIAAISPPAAREGIEVTIEGLRFGAVEGRLLFSPGVAADVSTWADDQIVANVPVDGADGSSIRIETALGLLSAPYPFVIADPTLPTLALVQASIFTPRCAFGSCHSTARSAGLSLVEGESYSNLVSVGSSQLPGVLRVAPFSPDTSLIIDKLTNDPPGVGDRMPLGGPYLTSEQIDLVRAWIDLGAPND